MAKRTPLTIDSNNLPNLLLIKEHSNRLVEIFKQAEKEQLWKIIEDKSYSYLMQDANILAKKAVYHTINKLRELFSIDSIVMGHLPSVVVLDQVKVQQYYKEMKLDMISGEPYRNIPLTFFTPNGDSYFNHPKGPVISLYLPSLDHDNLLEESFHFLQHFCETRGSERQLCQLNVEELFSNSINHECGAYLAQSIFGLTDKEIMKNVPRRKLCAELLEILKEEGRKPCYTQFLKSHNISSFEELKTTKIFLQRLGEFPSDIAHFLGYGLGETLHNITYDRKALSEIGKLILEPGIDPNKKLDDLVSIYQKNS